MKSLGRSSKTTRTHLTNLVYRPSDLIATADDVYTAANSSVVIYNHTELAGARFTPSFDASAFNSTAINSDSHHYIVLH